MAKGRQLFDDGDTSAYGDDQSDADLALLNYFVSTGATAPDQLDRLYCESAPYPNQPKWEKRKDYRERSIARALNGTVVPWNGWAQGPAAVRPVDTAPLRCGTGPHPLAMIGARLESVDRIRGRRYGEAKVSPLPPRTPATWRSAPWSRLTPATIAPMRGLLAAVEGIGRLGSSYVSVLPAGSETRFRHQ